MDRVREHVAADLAADVAGLLASAARPSTAARCEAARRRRDRGVATGTPGPAATPWPRPGCPAVYTGDTDVFASPRPRDWLCLLEAFEQPHRSGLVRAAAATRVLRRAPPPSLAAGGDELTDRVADDAAPVGRPRPRARGRRGARGGRWPGMAARVLACRGGERDLTDLDPRRPGAARDARTASGSALPALLDWLRAQIARAGRRRRAQPAARQRRRRGADHDGVGEQGPAVPGRLPALRLQPPRPGPRSVVLPPRGRPALPRHRRPAARARATSRPAAAPRWPATTSG